jgi:UDP-N-acetylmuramyl pentapeptide phosphotransferase/UDP-N-acetylglucosamine-1-phosphate transferase
MKRQPSDGSRWHPGITIHKMPVAGVGGLIFAVGIVVIALLGLPIAKWFLAGAVLLGVVIAGGFRLFRKLRPRTEVEEVGLKVERNRYN